MSIQPGETAEDAARRISGGSGGPGGEAEPALLMRLKAQAILESIDETGAWTVVSALLAFGTFLLETLNQVRWRWADMQRHSPICLVADAALLLVLLFRERMNRTTLAAGTCCTATTCH